MLDISPWTVTEVLHELSAIHCKLGLLAKYVFFNSFYIITTKLFIKLMQSFFPEITPCDKMHGMTIKFLRRLLSSEQVSKESLCFPCIDVNKYL